MQSAYPAKYRDRFGEEITTISNDGKLLRMVVRGIEFSGRAFDQFEPLPKYAKTELKSFVFFLDAICSFELDCGISVEVVEGDDIHHGMLQVHVELGKPDKSRSIHMVRKKEDGSVVEASPSLGKEILRLVLEYGHQIIKSQGVNLYSSFDEQLVEIKRQLPTGAYVKTCWNCAYSDYHPVGSGSFGGMACFRNLKDEYRAVKSKFDLMYLWDKRAEFVQEIHLCPEFEKRQPGEGGHYVG